MIPQVRKNLFQPLQRASIAKLFGTLRHGSPSFVVEIGTEHLCFPIHACNIIKIRQEFAHIASHQHKHYDLMTREVKMRLATTNRVMLIAFLTDLYSIPA